MEQTFWEKLFKSPAGSPNLGEAYGILKKDAGNKISDFFTGGHKLDRPIELDYGTAVRSNDFADIMGFRDRMNADGLFPSPGNKQRSEKSFQQLSPPEVQGIATDYEAGPQMGLQGQPQETTPYAAQILAVPQIKGREPVREIMPNEPTIQKYVRNATKWAGTVSADPKLTFRQKETVGENAEYVGKYVEAVMRLAPYFDLPPKTVASMAMQESGWGGQRFDGNLSGYGFLEGGEDMGYRFEAPTVEEQAAKFLEQLSAYKYKGCRTPEDFAARGYNQHKEYPGKVRSVMGMLEAE